MRTRADRESWQLMRALVFDRDGGRQAVSDALGMSFGKIKALRRIASLGPLPMRELASELGSDPPYTTVLVDDLEARGLVQRVTHPTDRRAKLVSVTTEGRRIARRAEAILARPPAGFANLSDAELAELHRLLTLAVES